MAKKRFILKKERYAGAIVLGLNDALVELTAALTGLTFALADSRIIALTGIITGFAAALSMAASEYLSVKEEMQQNKMKKPKTSAIYTGITYFLTVFVLVLPYLFFTQVYTAFGVMLFISLCIIFWYTYRFSTLKKISFWKRFREMAVLSFGIAFLSFIVGLLVKNFLI